jgi:hypothetical protein
MILVRSRESIAVSMYWVAFKSPEHTKFGLLLSIDSVPIRAPALKFVVSRQSHIHLSCGCFCGTLHPTCWRIFAFVSPFVATWSSSADEQRCLHMQSTTIFVLCLIRERMRCYMQQLPSCLGAWFPADCQVSGFWWQVWHWRNLCSTSVNDWKCATSVGRAGEVSMLMY